MKGFLILAALASLSFHFPCVSAEDVVTEHFSRLPQIQQVRLSPDGSKIAFINNLTDPELSLLSTHDLTTGKRVNLLKSDNESVKIRWFNWANNETVIISARYASKRGRTDTTETRLMSIAADGSEEMESLVRPSFRSSGHYSQFQDHVIDFLPDDPEHILIALDQDVANKPSVFKVNIYTKHKVRQFRGKLDIRDFMTDQQHKLRLAESFDYEDGDAKIYVRESEDDDWQVLFEYNAFEEPAIKPAGFDLDPNILYYKAYQNDMLALFKVDLKQKKHELVFADPQADVDGRLMYSSKTGGVIGLYHGNAPGGHVIWDESRKAFEKALNTALPETTNSLVGFSQDENIYVLYSESDTVPGMYLIGNRQAGTLDLYGYQYPDIDSKRLEAHKLVSYTARDGTSIEGYLTFPKGAQGPVPTILHPHGGPGSQDLSGFDYFTSYLSQRGYAVFRPNFRGSTGYGYSFAQAQMQGWGLAMQDDLTDAVHWLVEKGIADPDKVCIVGASYGGYAALMGTVKTPELYRCAISFAGVSNLKKLVRRSWRYVNTESVKRQIGEDSDDLEARSPYYQVKRILTPILLVHGEDDRVVDVEQSRIMADELKDEDKPFTYIELENGDHYLSIQRNRHRLFQEMDKFLDKHLDSPKE